MNREKIVIIGAGGNSRELKMLLQAINQVQPRYEFLGYVVSDFSKISPNDSKDEIIGDTDWLLNRAGEVSAVLGMGTPIHRLRVAAELKQKRPDLKFPILIHPSVIYDPESCKFGEGVTIAASNVLTVNITLGDYVFINRGCQIGHESVIGTGSVLNPSAVISGGVTIGEGVLIGTNATVIQYLQVGDYVTVGAGACVTKDVPATLTVVGIPAKPLQRGKS
ncbi:MAG: NeuD/PglB/VioB family sugar acetyltransferase [bacterium]|nr:NeuD/PglB/VioB family sugar acetyltransferase [bacterium]